MRKLNIFLGLAVIITTADALSQSHDSSHAGPCQKDLAKFCGNTPKGARPKIECLRNHRAQLSPECQLVLGNPKPANQCDATNKNKEACSIKEMHP